MGAQQPSGLHELFKKFWDSKDVDGMLTLYTDDAVLIGLDGTPVSGHAGIREVYEGMFALGDSEITFGETELSFESGDLALTHGSWKMTVDSNVVAEAQTAEVARRGTDGLWRYVIDNPVGTALLAGA